MSLSQTRKKILISNDDGLNSEGLNVLAEKLSEVCDVYIMAPCGNRSGVSHTISIDAQLDYVKHSDRVWSCSGSPADCVVAAFYSGAFGVKFDAVFSGINRGPNLGTDTIYSGTLAAARQAALFGIPGVSVSLESPELDYSQKGFNFAPLAEFCARNLDELLGLCKDDLYISINALSADKYTEAVQTSLCVRDYHDTVVLKPLGENKFSGAITGGKIEAFGDEFSDFDAIRNGKISISLIHAHPEAEMKGFEAKFKFN